MKIVIIGSGNVATVLGETIAAAGHPLLQVVARNEDRAAALAGALGCTYTTSFAGIDPAADLYVAALSDSALERLGETLTLPGKLVVHTAGALPAAILGPVSNRAGVLYPLQSLRAAIRPFPPIPLLVDAGNPDDLTTLETFAKTLSGQVRRADDATRLKLHLAATLTNNFTNYLYTLAAGYCEQERIDFTLLLPLIRETADRLDRYSPGAVQTGPAVRGDRPTIARHLDLLNNYQEIRSLYELFTNLIEEHYDHERTGKI
ncbi:MAG TPA: Rossmann-like and DUF2520 domain-containing protein [Puia sp.]|jgi:predicted short-subunit dehydrogenase-like oxidoreductase (DUF2520 family)|nr:Rossmann-like and DUF2520 domain-containing protein [Puia sp.]